MVNHIIIIGGGGHALVLADALLTQGKNILGYTAPSNQGELCHGVPYLGDDESINQYPASRIHLINGLGSVKSTSSRQSIYLHLRQRGYKFAHLSHPESNVSSLKTHLGNAYQILSGATISAGVSIGDNVLINTRAVVEHNSQIGNHCHIATGAIICGDCEIADNVHIGAGATLIQGIKVGLGAVIAAGAVVTKNVEPLTLVAGIPAIKKRELNERTLEKNSDRLLRQYP